MGNATDYQFFWINRKQYVHLSTTEANILITTCFARQKIHLSPFKMSLNSEVESLKCTWMSLNFVLTKPYEPWIYRHIWTCHSRSVAVMSSSGCKVHQVAGGRGGGPLSAVRHSRWSLTASCQYSPTSLSLQYSRVRPFKLVPNYPASSIVNHFSTTGLLRCDHWVRHSQQLCKKIDCVTSNQDFNSAT